MNDFVYMPEYFVAGMLLCCGIVAAVLAMICGKSALKEDTHNEGAAVSAIILGCVAVAFFAVCCIYFHCEVVKPYRGWWVPPPAKIDKEKQ